MSPPYTDKDLDALSGPAAGERDLDPTHLRAVAARMETLAALIELLKQAGEHRDEALADIKESVKRLEAEVDGILRGQSQFTETQIATLEEIILGRDRGKWLWARVKVVGGWFAATVACVLGLSNFWPGFAKLLRSVLQ